MHTSAHPVRTRLAWTDPQRRRLVRLAEECKNDKGHVQWAAVQEGMSADFPDSARPVGTLRSYYRTLKNAGLSANAVRQARVLAPTTAYFAQTLPKTGVIVGNLQSVDLSAMTPGKSKTGVIVRNHPSVDLSAMTPGTSRSKATTANEGPRAPVVANGNVTPQARAVPAANVRPQARVVAMKTSNSQASAQSPETEVRPGNLLSEDLSARPRRRQASASDSDSSLDSDSSIETDSTASEAASNPTVQYSDTGSNSSSTIPEELRSTYTTALNSKTPPRMDRPSRKFTSEETQWATELVAHAEGDLPLMRRCLRAAAVAVTNTVNAAQVEKSRNTPTPSLLQAREVTKLRSVTARLRHELSRRHTFSAPTQRQADRLGQTTRKQRMAKNPSSFAIREKLTRLQERLRMLVHRQRRDKERAVKMQERRRYARERKLPVEQQPRTAGPKAVEVEKFWRGIVGTRPQPRPTPQIDQWEATQAPRQAEGTRIDEATWQKAVSRTAPWKAPGPDGIYGWWWRTIRPATRTLRVFLQDQLGNPSAKWDASLTEGRTVLLFKKGDRADPKNYRPIACLNTAYKILTAAVAEAIRAQLVDRKSSLVSQQLALARGTWGCIHAHYVDTAVRTDARRFKRPLAVAWLDFKKAFDSVEHHALLRCLRGSGVAENVVGWIEKTMANWTTRFEVNEKGKDGQLRRKLSSKIQFRRGIFQGDSLSPLLFGIATSPVSAALDKHKDAHGFVSSKPTGTHKERLTLTHQVYADDLKLYARSAHGLEVLVKTAEQTASEVGLQLNRAKCAAVYHGTMASPKDELLPGLNNGDTYTWLGVEQDNGLSSNKATMEATRRKITAASHRIAKTSLFAHQQVTAFNTTVPGIIRYVLRAGGDHAKLSSTLADVAKMDKATRKAFNGGLRSAPHSIARLYLTPGNGGVGMKCLEDEVWTAIGALTAYAVLGPEDVRIARQLQEKAHKSDAGRTWAGDTEKLKSRLGIDLQLDNGVVTVEGTEHGRVKAASRSLTKLIQTKLTAERVTALHAQPLAGDYFVKREGWGVDTKRQADLLRKGRLPPTSYRNMANVLEQQVLTRMHPRSRKEGQDPTCRLGCNEPETIWHVLGSCKKKAFTFYTQRHDAVAQSLRRALQARRHPLVKPPAFDTTPPTHEKIGAVEWWWNHTFRTDLPTAHRKPDLVVVDDEEKTTTVYEIAICHPKLLHARQDQKRLRYERGYDDGKPKSNPITAELRRRWPTHKTDVVPVVIGYCGEWPTNAAVEEHLAGRGWRKAQRDVLALKLSTAAALHTARTVRDGRYTL